MRRSGLPLPIRTASQPSQRIWLDIVSAKAVATAGGSLSQAARLRPAPCWLAPAPSGVQRPGRRSLRSSAGHTCLLRECSWCRRGTSAQNNPEASLPSYRPMLRAERRTSVSGNALASGRGKAGGWEQPRQRTGVAQRRRKLRQTLQIVQHDCLTAGRHAASGSGRPT